MAENDNNEINEEINKTVYSDKSGEERDGNKREDLISQKLLADSLDLETELEKLPL